MTQAIKSLEVLPIWSNPEGKDSDGDGIWDCDDPMPLVYNSADEIKIYNFFDTACISEITYMFKMSEQYKRPIASAIDMILVFRNNYGTGNIKKVIEELKDVDWEFQNTGFLGTGLFAQSNIEYHVGILLANYELHRKGTSFEELTLYWEGQQQQVIKMLFVVAIFRAPPKFSNSIKTESAATTNAYFYNKGYTVPPVKHGTNAYVVTLTRKTKPGEFVRVYGGGAGGQEGQFIMRAKDIKGLTPQEIQTKFALPGNPPTHVVDVILPKGTTIRYSTANAIFEQPGGGLQIDLMGQHINGFINSRPLP